MTHAGIEEPKHDHEFGVHCRPECPRWGNTEPQADWEPQQEWYFTFGANHVHPDTGERLGNAYVVIHGTCDSTRAAMFDLFGNRWSQQYQTAEAAGVERFALRQVDLPTPDLPPFEAEVAVHAARLEAERPAAQPVTPAEERTGISDVQHAVLDEVAEMHRILTAAADGRPWDVEEARAHLDRIELWTRGEKQ